MAPDRRAAPAVRSWVMTAAVTAIAAGSFAAYQVAPPAVADVAGVVYAISLMLGPALIYPWSRRHGLSPGYSIAAALVVPALWLGKECWAVGAVFGGVRALYYAANPLALGVFVAATLQMALAEVLLRRATGGRWQFVNGAGLTLAGIALLAGGYALAAARYDHTIIFWAYIALYRRLFE